MRLRAGRYQRLNLEVGVAGDTRYLRSDYQFQQFFPLNNRFTIGLNTELGYGTGLSGKPYPVFKNFYGGGLGTVRGFEQNSLGPADIEGAYIGGARRFNINTEFYVPFPGAGNDRTLRMFAYADAGNVWGEQQTVKLADLRASVGVGVSWISPVGPLKLSYGKPIAVSTKIKSKTSVPDRYRVLTMKMITKALAATCPRIGFDGRTGPGTQDWLCQPGQGTA